MELATALDRPTLESCPSAPSAPSEQSLDEATASKAQPAPRSKRAMGEQTPGPDLHATLMPKKQKLELTAREQAQLRLLADVSGLHPVKDARGRRKGVSVNLSAHLSELVSGALSGAAHDTHLSSPACDGTAQGGARPRAERAGAGPAEPETAVTRELGESLDDTAELGSR